MPMYNFELAYLYGWHTGDQIDQRGREWIQQLGDGLVGEEHAVG